MVAAAALASCSPYTLDEAPVPVATGTPIPTATIDWFPVTETFTPAAAVTHAATPETQLPTLATILTDQFDDPDQWEPVESALGTAIVAGGQLTLAVQPGGLIRSLRSAPALDDFYAQVTARPNLCRGEDAYGVLIRATAIAYYRFALYCDGTASAERIVHTRIEERHVLQEAVPSGDAPPGAPGRVRIGVSAQGGEMRLFLNDRLQFVVSDVNYPEGLIGFFAQSATTNAVTVSFSELVVGAVEPATAAATEPGG